MIKLGKGDVFDERCRAVVYLLGGEVSSTRFYLAKRKPGIHSSSVVKNNFSEYWDGYGGLYQSEDRDIYATAIRKLKEKAGGLRIFKKDLILIGRVKIFHPGNLTTNHDREVFFFIARMYSKYPVETKKMGKPSLHTVYDAPFDLMRPADGLIIRSVLSGKKVEGVVYLKIDENGARTVAKSNLIVACRKDIP
jgi:hypothetical protein